MHPALILAQDQIGAAPPAPPTPAAPPAPEPWYQFMLDNPLAVGIAFVFLATVVTILIKNRRRDKCLKLLDDYHVNYITTAGKTIWGDLIVYTNGLEMVFDAPYRNSLGMLKTSAIIYQKDLENALVLCRSEQGLPDHEIRARRKQVDRCLNPGLIRKGWRWIRNLFNSLSDAFSKAFSMVVAHVLKTKPAAGAIAGQQSQVDTIGQTILGAVGNAYEPILERHIGKPVILELASPADPDKKPMEIHGYLAEYSNTHLAVFNLDHEPVETIELELTESHEADRVKVDLTDKSVAITNTGPKLLLVRSLVAGEHEYKLSVAVTRGSTMTLRREGDGPVKLVMERTEHIDIVCPRTQAGVHFGSDPQVGHEQLTERRGVAPAADVEGAGGITGSMAQSDVAETDLDHAEIDQPTTDTPPEPSS